MLAAFRHWVAANAMIAYDRHRALENLSGLSDAQLLDIGLLRGTLAEHVSENLPWQPLEGQSKPAMQASVQGCG